MGWSSVYRRVEVFFNRLLTRRIGEYCPFDSLLWPSGWPLVCFCCGRLRDYIGGRSQGTLIATGGKARRSRKRGGLLQRGRGEPPRAIWWPKEDYFRMELWEVTLASWLFLRCYRWPRGTYGVVVETSADDLRMRVTLRRGGAVTRHVLNVGSWTIGKIPMDG